MTYNVFGGTLSLTQSINQSTEAVKTDCQKLCANLDVGLIEVRCVRRAGRKSASVERADEFRRSQRRYANEITSACVPRRLRQVRHACQ